MMQLFSSLTDHLQLTTGLALACALLIGNNARAEINLDFVKKNAPSLNWTALEKGQIVWEALPKIETQDAALVTITAVKLPVGKEAALKQLQSYSNELISLPLDTQTNASVRQSLNAFAIAGRDDVNLDWFFKPKDNGTYNVSKEELQTLQKNAEKMAQMEPAKARKQLEKVIQDLLARRVNEYRKGGLAGISPYSVNGKTVSPGDYLANSLEPLAFLQKAEPAFFTAFSEYPKKQPKNYQQQFFLSMEMDDKRPITSLKHWLVDDRENLTIIGERKFYISHSLEAMHTLILILEEQDASYVFLLNQTFTEKVTGIGSFIAHKVGRGKVKQNIMPMFEHLRDEALADAR